MATHDGNDISDDEIFFGKMTIKEVKKHLQADMHRHSATYNNTEENGDIKYEDSFKIIETCSEPDLKISSTFNDSFSSISNELKGATCEWNINSTNSSFLEMEKLVSEADMYSTNEQNDLDNTLNVIDYILKHSSAIKDTIFDNDIVNIKNSANNSLDLKHMEELPLYVQNISLTEKETKCKVITNEKVSNKTVSNHDTEYLNKNGSHNHGSTSNLTGNLIKKNPDKTGANLKEKVENFKTPKAGMSTKKSYLTSNIISSKTYKHVTSPVAAYIKSTTLGVIVKNVNRTKPFREVSSIPVLLSTFKKKPNKETDNLPLSAYKNAKHVKVFNNPAIDPDKTNLMSPSNKQIFSSLPTSLVIHKHVMRKEINSIRKCADSGEGSFANLTLQQAEESLCTIASFNSEKKYSK